MIELSFENKLENVENTNGLNIWYYPNFLGKKNLTFYIKDFMTRFHGKNIKLNYLVKFTISLDLRLFIR